MTAPPHPGPSRRAMVPFVSVADMMRLVHHLGLRPMLADLTSAIEAQFRR